jgi:hypothetical protein
MSQPLRPPIIAHLRGKQSAGDLALIEVLVEAGSAGPPLHVHPGHAEGFYVLDGERNFDQLAAGITADPPDDALRVGPPIGGAAKHE